MEGQWQLEIDRKVADLSIRVYEMEKVQAIHGSEINTLKEFQDEIRKNTTWILRLVITGITSAVSATAIYILKVLMTGGILDVL